jgi:hemerythrin-like metal-binding protein
MQNDTDFEYPAVLGLASVDRAHRTLFDALAELARASDPEFARDYPSLVAALERDFREEEMLMEKAGLSSYKAHLEQHARVLSALHHAAARVMEGDFGPGREAVGLLSQWLLVHIPAMDKALIDGLH